MIILFAVIKQQYIFVNFQMFNIYIKRAAEIYGVTHTRAIYEKAIEILTEEHSRYNFLSSRDIKCKIRLNKSFYEF